jgi:hypothetical protein
MGYVLSVTWLSSPGCHLVVRVFASPGFRKSLVPESPCDPYSPLSFLLLFVYQGGLEVREFWTPELFYQCMTIWANLHRTLVQDATVELS